jgi:6-phospho-3-hexuloisomerase
VTARCENLLAILEELTADAALIDGDQLVAVERLIVDAERVFCAGAGRSGFAARGFANRLMHLGFASYFVGEPTTPSIRAGDLLIVGSGSGETASLVSAARKARAEGAALATVTIFPGGTIGLLADAAIVVPGVTSKVQADSGKAGSIQTKGSSFEQLSWLIYDAIVIDLKRLTGQSDDDMYYRHANME